MNNYKRAIFLLTLFLCPSLANHQQWRPIFIGDNFSYLLDDTSVQKYGYILDATIGILTHLPIKIENFMAASASYFIQANCINKSIAVKRGVLFNNPVDQSGLITYNAPKIFKMLISDTIEQQYLRALCMS